MLDDLKYIHSRDSQDALGIAEKQWQQLKYKYQVSNINYQVIENVVWAGMGGSAWPALFINTWPGLRVPFELVSRYELPQYVNQNTLVIVSSYSGNTEEILSALSDAENKKAQIAVIAAGGKLVEIAQAKNYPLFQVPSGLQPRMSSFYFYVAAAQLLTLTGLIEDEKHQELEKAADWLSSHVAKWRPDVPAVNNPAKKLAYELVGKTVIVYSGPLMAPAANKWKICINESAKNLSWWNQYSEFNHNEFIGWTSHPVDKPFAVVELRSNLEHPRIQKRFVISEKLLSGKRPAPQVVQPVGDNILEQLIWAANFGEFVSIYLAVLNGVNPTPVDLVEKLKKELG